MRNAGNQQAIVRENAFDYGVTCATLLTAVVDHYSEATEEKLVVVNNLLLDIKPFATFFSVVASPPNVIIPPKDVAAFGEWYGYEAKIYREVRIHRGSEVADVFRFAYTLSAYMTHTQRGMAAEDLDHFKTTATSLAKTLDVSSVVLSSYFATLSLSVLRSIRTMVLSPSPEAESTAEMPIYFLSYAHRNKGEADNVELGLSREHRNVWRDETDLRAGRPLLPELISAIERAHTFVCLLSEEYVRSRYCSLELEKAVHRSVASGSPRVIVLRVDSVEVPSAIQSGVWIDAQSREAVLTATRRMVAEE